MELPTDQIWQLLLSQGLAGVVIIVQFVAIVKLYNRIQELSDTLTQVGRETVAANESTTSALNRLSDRITDILWIQRKPEKVE